MNDKDQEKLRQLKLRYEALTAFCDKTRDELNQAERKRARIAVLISDIEYPANEERMTGEHKASALTSREGIDGRSRKM